MKILIKIATLLLLLHAFHSCSTDDDPTTEPIAQPELEPVPTVSNMNPTSGPKTTIVSFTGSNFGTDSSKIQVFFDDIPATVQSVMETEIIVIVPARAFSGAVKLIINESEFNNFVFDYIIVDIDISTLAGSSEGSADGIGANAQFNFPTFMAADNQGTLYVVDTSNDKIRKVTPEGVVSTFAGSTRGFADGSGTNAQFQSPEGIAIDDNGTVYVADTFNHKIRKITPDGVVSTFVGSTKGFADGSGANAQFDFPVGMAIDAQGMLYVADAFNHKIRKITPEGVVTTLAGSIQGSADGETSSAQFSLPKGIVIDANGNLLVTDTNNSRIRKITPEGMVSTLAGSTQGSSDGQGSNAQFKNPQGIAITADGTLYVTDSKNHSIRKISPEGNVSTLAGSIQGTEDGNVNTAQFSTPYGIVIDNSRTIYIADNNTDRIRKITQE